jgi:hypothetical protein
MQAQRLPVEICREWHARRFKHRRRNIVERAPRQLSTCSYPRSRNDYKSVRRMAAGTRILLPQA